MGTTEAMALNAGHARLSAKELKAMLLGTTVQGLYRGGFRFITFIDHDCKMEGKNHVGSHNFGVCRFDRLADTFSVSWDNGWDQLTTRAYRVGVEVMFFDVATGLWSNTLTAFLPGRQLLEID